MNSKYKLVFTTAAVIIVLDQLTKWWVVSNMAYGMEWVVFERFFSLVHYRNKGAAFGVLSNWESHYRDIFFYVLALIAMGFLFSLARQTPESDRRSLLPIGLIFGGAVGNILDRIFRGSVVDFLSVHWDNKRIEWVVGDRSFDFYLVWPAFNVADGAITVGVVWLMLQMLKEPKKETVD